jgi:hypothetical protein
MNQNLRTSIISSPSIVVEYLSLSLSLDNRKDFSTTVKRYMASNKA